MSSEALSPDSVSVCSCSCLYMCVLAADPSLPAIYVHQLMKHNYVYLSVSFPASVVELSLSVYVCMHVHMCVDCRRLSPSTSTYMYFFCFLSSLKSEAVRRPATPGSVTPPLLLP